MRLGAIVCATDVRPSAKEQVDSRGATFVALESEETKDAETASGYAKELSEEYRNKQNTLIAEKLKEQDIVICTALIPDRPAPLLLIEEMVKNMKQGSVVVDLAVEQGGNCALSKPGHVVRAYGVTVLGHLNMPGRLAADASALYAKNLLNFIALFINPENGRLKIDWEDEIIKGTSLTRNGAVIHGALV
jgi:NAD(P) transhydrogenase subunit alpha